MMEILTSEKANTFHSLQLLCSSSSSSMFNTDL